MDMAKLIESLERFGNLLPAVVQGVSIEDARWRPPNGAWSVLEVVCHLADEEVADFRARLESTLRAPDEPWKANDPEAWAVERRYNEQDLKDVLARFTAERRQSVGWLRTLAEPDFSRTYQHPKFGPIQAGDIMVSWAAHDMLHLRQIAKRLFQMAQRDGQGFSSAYAGEWKA
ncbi:MAG: DinB family protein [Phycisphaerales bacterium]|nr:MAG: DinB family protein [Phycisphaerales bacterium]